MTWSDQLPPHDIAAEESVIASVLVDAEAMNKVATILEARDFFRESHAWTFEACHALWLRNESINQVTVAHELDRRSRLEDVGGLSFLSDLVLNLPTPVGAEHFAAIVKRDATYRQMIRAAMNIATIAYAAGPNVYASMARAEAELYALRDQNREQGDFVHLSELLRAYDGPAERAPREQRRVPSGAYAIRTGLHGLDAVLGSLRPGQLIVVAAHTSVGKSAFAVNTLARNAAILQHARVAIFTLEVGGKDLALRMLTAEARVPTKTIRDEETDETQDERIAHALMLLTYADIYIDSTGGIQPGTIKARCLKLAKEHGLDLVIIDHLQIMRADKPSNNRYADVSSITGELKALALQLDVAVVLCSQLNREHPGQIPILSDLRDSGSIEQDADVVLFIHREEMEFKGADEAQKRDQWFKTHDADEPYPAGHAYVVVAKQRDGAVGQLIDLRYRAPYTKFEDFDLPATAPTQAAIPDFLRKEEAYH